MGKTAVVFGATGLVGSHLLQHLLNDQAYTRVIAVSRRNIGFKHAKIQTVITELTSIDRVGEELWGDCYFCCVGSTFKQTPNRSAYYAVDHDYPVKAAKIGKVLGVKTFILISAVGANQLSGNFYIKMKGETERDVAMSGIAHIGIFRPSLLTGNRQTPRLIERMSALLMKVINPILQGASSRFRSIPANQLAKAMVAASHHTHPGVTIYNWRDIKKWQ